MSGLFFYKRFKASLILEVNARVIITDTNYRIWNLIYRKHAWDFIYRTDNKYR